LDAVGLMRHFSCRHFSGFGKTLASSLDKELIASVLCRFLNGKMVTPSFSVPIPVTVPLAYWGLAA
jgi:hypothetical protein